MILMFFLVAYNDNIYIFGGYNGQLNKHFADLWKFDPGNKLLLSRMRRIMREPDLAFSVKSQQT